MMNLSVANVCAFFVLTWGTNIALNLLYVLKKFFPKVGKLDMPVDGGLLLWDKRRMVGDSTTVFGIVVVLLCGLVFFYSNFFVKEVALLAPILVYFGHLLGSFVKRRFDKEFIPFVDHGDYVPFSGVVLSLLHLLAPRVALITLLITYLLHPLATLVAFRFGLREKSY